MERVLGTGGMALATAALLLLALAPLLLPSASADGHWTVRDRILIDGDADFTPENGVVGGSGTEGDPYLIAGWEVEAPSGTTGIRIQDTTLPFVVRDVRVGGSGDHSQGIWMLRVLHGRVEQASIGGPADGVLVEASQDVVVQDSQVAGTLAHGIRVLSSASVGIEDNVLADNVGPAVWVEQTQGFSVLRNAVRDNGRGVWVVASTQGLLADNAFQGDGLILEGATAAHVADHEVRGNTVNDRPLLYHRTCQDLVLDAPLAGQVIVANCRNVTVEGLVVANTDVALTLAFVEGGRVLNASLTDSVRGLELRAASDVRVVGNTFARNGNGLRLFGSAQVTAYHNAFVDNGRHVTLFETQGMTWHRGYPEGGNHWSDYDGQDVCRGPAQDDCSGPDGIGDTPYTIEGGLEVGQDPYPLMEPFAPDEEPDAPEEPAAPPFPLLPVALAVAGVAGGLAVLAWVLVRRRAGGGRLREDAPP